MSEPHRVTVNVPPRPYDVTVQRGILRSIDQAIPADLKAPKICVVTDTNVAPHYLASVRDALARRFQVHVCILPAGEEHKTLASIGRIYDEFLPKAIDRKTPLLALGGGVIGDMTGFAAATILRGVPFIQVPTTLLSMVDASVGGKTGIDHACGKNLIGAFHQPHAVLIDPEVLLTLPDRELTGGLAECIKHDIIRDGDYFHARLPQVIARAKGKDVATLADLIAHNVAIKARVVEADPTEQGERAHLNFGHTFGHAIESVSNYSYSHGESVALGMVAASLAALSLKLIDAAAHNAIKSAIALAGLPTSGLRLDIDKCVAALAYDKKVSGKKIRFVLPDRIGHVVIRNDLSPECVRAAFAGLV